jgi:hypothetical protein
VTFGCGRGRRARQAQTSRFGCVAHGNPPARSASRNLFLSLILAKPRRPIQSYCSDRNTRDYSYSYSSPSYLFRVQAAEKWPQAITHSKAVKTEISDQLWARRYRLDYRSRCLAHPGFVHAAYIREILCATSVGVLPVSVSKFTSLNQHTDVSSEIPRRSMQALAQPRQSAAT